jgi:hypothetical protein
MTSDHLETQGPSRKMLVSGHPRIGSRRRAAGSILLTACSLLSVAHAAVFRCVDANGANTYSDRPCAPAETDRAAKPDGVQANPAEASKIKKAARILDLLRIAPSEPESLVLQRTVDDAAPDLVKALDPDNGVWTPANARWHSVLEFVKGDLRRDVQTALRQSSSEISHITAQAFAARADEADLDAVLRFLATGDGSRYLVLENEIRRIVYEALDSLVAQESVPEQPPTDAQLHRRQALLALTLDYRIVKDGGGPPPTDLDPGSTAVVEYSARHDGAALDALAYEYEPDLPAFQAFTDSPATKRMFRALAPAARTYAALSPRRSSAGISPAGAPCTDRP